MISFLDKLFDKTPDYTMERDDFPLMGISTERRVVEGKYCRVFIGPPRIIPLQTSTPSYPFGNAINSFSQVSSLFGHKPEKDASPEELVPIFAGRVCYQSFGDKAGRKTAEEYLSHIMEVGHYSILEHSYVTMYMDRVPRYWSHEQVRHRHFNYSQLSQRFFVPDKLELVVPPVMWYDPYIEQEFLEYGEKVGKEYYNKLDRLYAAHGSDSFALKKKNREAARAILPECTETKIVVTGNFRSWLEYLGKRDTPEADAMFQEVAKLVRVRLQAVAPNIFAKGK